MKKKFLSAGLALTYFAFNSLIVQAESRPPSEIDRVKIIEMSQQVLNLPDMKVKEKENVFRIQVLGLDWDVAGKVYEPEESSNIPTDPNGNKIGMFLIHGGSGDHRSKEKEARFLVSKFGYKVVTMSYPGRLYLLDPSRDWPGDTLKLDGMGTDLENILSVRTPIWNKDKLITRNQYEITEDKSLQNKYGTLTLACAKEGTEFYKRMSGWPMAFEAAGKDLMNRHLPVGEYSIYIHGHSTGGPFSLMLTQRVKNIVGVTGMENSPFGYIFRVQTRSSGNPTGKQYGDLPFNCLHVRTWRDTARYAGPEALMQEGPEALMQLPTLIEKVFASWKRRTAQPNFKAEGPIHFGSVHQLSQMARATAKRLDLSTEKTQELIEHYVSLSRELRGLGVKPVPPIIFGMSQSSADHTPEKYREVTLPMFASMDPPPKVSLVEFKAGTHGYTRPEEDLPMGPFPAVAKVWHDAIMEGYYSDYASRWATEE